MAEIRNRKRGSSGMTNLLFGPSTEDEETFSSKNNFGFSRSTSNLTAQNGFENYYDNLVNQRASNKEAEKPVHLDDSTLTPVKYPDNIGTFADGLKGDIFELFETGAKVLNKSFKLLLPFGSDTPGGSDAIKDIEIRSPLQNLTNKGRYRSSSQQSSNSSISNVDNNSQNSKPSTNLVVDGAIRMRCASMWTDKKDSKTGDIFLPLPKQQPQQQHGAPATTSSSSNIRVKEGVKVQLGKLNANGSIQSFECCDETLLLVGNRRVILASKNFDEGNTGTVIWSQPLHDIDSCTITFNSNPSVTSPTKVRLELSTQGGKMVRKVLMPNTIVCSKALQVIQERKVKQRVPDQKAELQPGASRGNNHEEYASSSNEKVGNLDSLVTQIQDTGDFPHDSTVRTSESANTLLTPDDVTEALSSLVGGLSSSITLEGKSSSGSYGTQDSLVYTPSCGGKPHDETGNAETRSTGKSKKSPELIAADALIADITAILQNIDIKEKGQGGSHTSSNRGTMGDTSTTCADNASSEFASPAKRACYGHFDKDFSSALLPNLDHSPATGVVLSFSPVNGQMPQFSLGQVSPKEESGNSGRKKHRRRSGNKHGNSPLSNSSGLSFGSGSCFHSTCAHGPVAGKHLKGVHEHGYCAACTGGHSGIQVPFENFGGLSGFSLPLAPVFGQSLQSSDSNDKFQEMLKTRLPLVAVQHTLMQEGADPDSIAAVSGPVAQETKGRSTADEEKIVSKFKMMLKAGVPLEAVKHKMQLEGTDPELLNRASVISAANPVDDTKAMSSIKATDKYQKMLKAGVPLEAVKQKMRQDGVDPELLSGVEAKPEISSETKSYEKTVEKYQKMFKAGVPLEAVKQKMRQDGVDPELLNGSGASAQEVETKPGFSAEEEKAVFKFKMMLKAGVPLEAVKQKMRQEGVNPDLLEGPKAAPVFDTSKLKKFQMMLKAGVEAGAVVAKMSQEGFSKEEQEFVTGQSKSVPTVAAPANKLIALHWDPMSNIDMKNSIWGELQGSNKIKGLEEGEMERLTSMFCKKENKIKKDDEKKVEEKTSGPPKLRVIDTTRAMNISIGLTSFKSQDITVEQMGNAILALDTKVLGIDCLLRIKEILPNEGEIKSLKTFNAENGHPAEVCLFKLAQIPRLRTKVESMICMNTMQGNGSDLITSLNTLREVAGRILMSESLREILVSVLAIGNAMNEGSRKGSAMGFRLGSLIKLAQTKSTDGKHTVIDYLIIVLHERAKGGSSVCEAALEIDDELSLIKKSKHLSLSEITKDCSALEREVSLSCSEVSHVVKALKEDSPPDSDTCESIKENISILEGFIGASNILTTSVKNSLKDTCEKFEEMALFFSEDPANVGTILGTLSEFIDHFSAAKQSFNRKNRKRPL